MGAEETLFQRFGKEFPKGTVLFQEGEPGKDMFVLQSGKISISKKRVAVLSVSPSACRSKM